VLEHVYECRTAFANLCRLSRDLVIVVVPFLQPYHGSYGDFWRFTPLALQRMYADNGLELLTCTFNEQWVTSVYLFAIGSRQPARWAGQFPEGFSLTHPRTGRVAGDLAIPKIRAHLRSLLRRRDGH